MKKHCLLAAEETDATSRITHTKVIETTHTEKLHPVSMMIKNAALKKQIEVTKGESEEAR